MPPRPTTPEGHERQARRNESLARSLARTQSSAAHQWAAIVAFYAALHLVDKSVLDAAGTRSPDHEDRNKAVEARYPEIDDQYKLLYQRSRALRYDLDEIRVGELDRLFAALDQIRTHLTGA